LAADTQGVFAHGGNPKVIYFISRRTGSLVSTDAGRTWRPIHATPAPGLDREGNWKRTFGGGHTAILGDPRSATAAVAYSHATLWRSQDDPAAFADSSTGFTGYAWGWWRGGMAFHPTDRQRFRLLCFDIGSVETRNGGAWFERDRLPYEWVRDGTVHWSGMYNGSHQPREGSEVVVASAGRYWDNRLVRSADSGETWAVVEDDTENYFFVGFHPTDPDLVFAGTKRSSDAGRSFEPIEGLRPWAGYVVGIAPGRPDTIYAISGDRRAVLRSDDRGATWRQYARPGWTLSVFSPSPLFAVHPTDPDRIYSLDRDGDLAEFDGRAWRSLNVLEHVGASRPRNCVVQVVFDPRRPEVVYAATHTCGLPFLFRSLDGGQTWRDISGNLPRIGGGGLAVSPWTGEVFIGGCCGTRVFPPPYDSPDALYHRLAER
ncbi:MAG: hypothetical protein GX591_05610, partial [Planctomycetes bacterium]|nr:hypothetical protein [Planctomycetota bacterium]